MIGWIKQAIAGEAPKPRSIPASLFIRDESFGISSLPFDLLINESHRLEFDISDHAVENGATISDHIQEHLRSVEVNGMFTNHPIGTGSNSTVDSSGEVQTEKTSIKIYDGDYDQSTMINSARDRWDDLKKIARKRGKVRLVTSLEIYEEMVIESLSADRGESDGESVKFTMRLREIRTATLESKNIPGVWNPPQPETLDSDEAKAVSSETKTGTVQGVETEVDAKVDVLKRINEGKKI